MLRCAQHDKSTVFSFVGWAERSKTQQIPNDSVFQFPQYLSRQLFCDPLNLHQLLGAGLCHSIQRAELFQQRFLAAPDRCPGSVQREARPCLLRRLRWAVMAKRCASSRTRCSKYKPCELRGRSSGLGFAGQKEHSSSLGQPGHRHLAGQLNFQHLTARPSWPLPPSTISRSGSRAKAGSIFSPDFMRRLRCLPALEAAREHFLHAGKIVRALTALDIEAPVKLLVGHALLKTTMLPTAAVPWMLEMS